MITVYLDKNKEKPLYMQLYEEIKEMIISGKLSEGEALPSKRSLASHLNVSVKTVENAYYQLVLEGYVASKEKSGFYVGAVGNYRRRMVPKPKYVSKYKERKFDVDLRSNANPTFPFNVFRKNIRDAIDVPDENMVETVPFNGIDHLREAISDHLREFRGMNVSADQIIIGCGTEYLYSRLIQMLGYRRYAMEDPGYTHIRKIFKSNKVDYRVIPVDNNGIRTDLLENADCDIVHLSTACHFPLGFSMPVQRRIDLFEWANRKGGRYIIEDDYNSEFRYHGSMIPTLFEMDTAGKVIYMNTFSKTIAPALRISYMVLPDRLMDHYISTMSFYSCTVSSLQQRTTAQFLEAGHMERYVNTLRHSFIEQRHMFERKIAEMCDPDIYKLHQFSAGTHFLLEIRTDISDEDIHHALVDKDILVFFVSQYCEQWHPEYEHLLIMNYSNVTEEKLEKFLRILNEIVVEKKGCKIYNTDTENKIM